MAKKKPLIVKNCAVCGKEFKTVYSQHVSCSGECRYQWNRIRTNARHVRIKNMKPFTRKKCVICDKDFETKNKAQVTCLDPECRFKNRSQQKLKSQKIIRDIAQIPDKCSTECVCPGCGKKHTMRLNKIDIGKYMPRRYCRDFPGCLGGDSEYCYATSYNSSWEGEWKAMI